MLMMSLFYLVCVFILVHAFGQQEKVLEQRINWEPFEILENLDGNAIAVIKELPLYQYWDVLKGSFRTGLIGDTILKSHPQFVTILEKKVPKGGKLSSAAENCALDFSALYMYSLMALKNLIYISHNLADTYELSTGLQTAKRDDFSLVRSKSFASIAELRLVKAVLEQRKRKEDIADATIQEHSNAEMVKLRFRNLTKVSHMREIHEMLSEEQLLYFGRIRESHAAKYQHLTAQLSAYEKEKLRSEGSALSDQFSDEVAQLRVALNATMAALTFRAAEELRVAMQLQKLEEEQLLGTQSELLQAEVEEVINAFFAELYQWVQMVADHPGAALTVCKLLLAGFGVLLLALELRQVCLAVMEKLTGASYLPKVVRLAKSSDGGCRDLQWSSAVQVQVCKVVQAIAGAACNGLVLPNVLILGASGTGKSALIKRIVADVAAAAAATAPSVEMQLLSVCGADLLALGDAEAALFLNDLIRKQSHSGRLVLVVDDADCIIAGRNPPQHSPLPSTGPHEEGERADNCHKQQSTSICLFSLLAGLRVNSPHILLVLAARLDVSQVDCALLDRMDDIISLVGPADSERLAYAVSALRPLLEKVRSSTSSSGSGSVSTRHVNLHVQQALNALEAEQVLRLVLAADLGPVLGADWADLDRNLDLDTDHSADGRSRRSSSSSRSSSHDRRAVDPETDRPHLLLASSGALVSAGGAAHQVALTLAALRRYLSSSPSSFDQDISLDVLLCLRVMLLLSAKWSYRDLKQFFSALTYAVMCEDRCELTTKMWIRELLYSFD